MEDESVSRIDESLHQIQTQDVEGTIGNPVEWSCGEAPRSSS